ncbi:GGDEF domain-containing protein [Rhizorhapis sp. SPR117]|uniref:GGDEF domain-containing protein n=1 Tax=Rhizorhapis sp. SPR117 TaxID=2912611 RepID=UPI001F3CC9A7|nr:GGDEF domain-containing protein [Rhizorhapis sp. SPR117]
MGYEPTSVRNEHGTPAVAPRGRLSQWLGHFSFNLMANEDGGDAAAMDNQPCHDRAENRRARLYQEIGEFMFAHDLDLTPLNFGLAYDYVTGNDRAIEQAVRAIIMEKGKLTNGQAETILAETHKDEFTPEAMTEMLDSVESNFAQLSELVKQSQHEATHYGAALQAQVKDLSVPEMAEPVMGRLIALTRSMIDKSRAVEAQMRESHSQTRLLKKNLDHARKAAEQDHLTGLPNRRAFEATLREAALRAQGNGKALSIAFCDIDHFKQINDVHGHDVGDRILKFVGKLLADISNDTCHVARHGGEEFVMLFEGQTTAAACEIVDAARIDLSSRTLVNKTTGERLDKVSFSAGIADVAAYEDARAALRAADAAMYDAKTDGRNRVYIAAA